LTRFLKKVKSFILNNFGNVKPLYIAEVANHQALDVFDFSVVKPENPLR
jgi:hypothetical protein